MREKDQIKIWAKKNYVYWHSLRQNKGMECHHINGRIGIYRACLALYSPAEFGHTDNWQFINELKRINEMSIKIVKGNYVKFLGCKEEKFNECKYCAVTKIHKTQDDIL